MCSEFCIATIVMFMCVELLNFQLCRPSAFKNQLLVEVFMILCSFILTLRGHHRYHSMDSIFFAIVHVTATGIP